MVDNYVPAELYYSLKHVEADTASELEDKMLRIRVRLKDPVTFSTPQYAEGKWHTWFSHDFSKKYKGREKLQFERQKVPEENE